MTRVNRRRVISLIDTGSWRTLVYLKDLVKEALIVGREKLTNIYGRNHKVSIVKAQIQGKGVKKTVLIGIVLKLPFIFSLGQSICVCALYHSKKNTLI